MYPNAKGSEQVGILAAINPTNEAAGTSVSGWVPMSGFDRVLAVVMLGALGASGTVDANIQQAQDATGTGAKAITGKAITEINATSNQQALIDLHADELDVTDGYGYIQLSVITAVAASETSALLLGINPRYPAAPQAATVLQTVG